MTGLEGHQRVALRRWRRSSLYFRLAQRTRQILDRFITAPRQLLATKLVADRLRCPVRHHRTEIDEDLPLAIR